MNCTLYCASYLLGVSPSTLIKEIGHDGSAVEWPEYDDDRRFRGFSLAEIQTCFWMRNKMLAPIFVYPMISPEPDAKRIHIWSHERAAQRYNDMVTGRQAIIVGRLLDSLIMHAVVYDGDKYIDPRNPVMKDTLDYLSPQEIYIVCRL
jgi:hypothetical protein